MVLATAGCGDAGSDTPKLGEQAATNTGSPPEPKPSFKVGDAVDYDTFEITVKEVERLDKVGRPGWEETPAEGGILVAVTYRLKNTGSQPLGMFDRPTLRLMDAAGVVYNPDSSATAAFGLQKDFNSSGMSDLNPGITIETAEVFEIASQAFNPSTYKVVLRGHEEFPISMTD